MSDNNIEVVQPSDPLSPDEMIRQVLSSIPQDTLKSMQLFAKKEDYTANIISNRTVEELPMVVTILTEIFKKAIDNENLAVALKDEYGIDVDLVGTKGYIPTNEMPYNKQANFSAIFTALENGVYRVIYKTDPETGMVERDTDNKPIVLKKIVVNGGVELRNKNQLNNLALEGMGRIQQTRILGAYGQVNPIGMDGSLDSAIVSMFAPGGGNKKNRWGRK